MRKLLLVCLMLVVDSVWAEWEKVDQNHVGTFYIDQTTIRKDHDLRKVWTVLNYANRDTDGAISRRNRMEYDCKENRMRLLSTGTWTGPLASGTPVSTEDKYKYEPSPWMVIQTREPHTIILKLVCAEKQSIAPVSLFDPRTTATPTTERSSNPKAARSTNTNAKTESKSNTKTERSSNAKTEFKKQNPCPVTGSSKGSCKGYVVGYKKPLSCGGADAPHNMQWQTKAAAKKKAKRKEC